jgi:hypothetical protein
MEVALDIIKLPFGEQAPNEGDCISIIERTDGRFDLNATALLACGDTDEAESVSMIGGDSYPTYEEAEAAGLAWADGHCVEKLFVSRLPVGVVSGP